MLFSSQYSEDGALIYNISFASAQELKAQLGIIYGITLEDRKEAHITVLTPPEAKGTFNPNGIGVNHFISTEEIQKTYSSFIQNSTFKIICVGTLKQENKRVFYLVVQSKDLMKIRKEIQDLLEYRASLKGIKTYFQATDYTPHITLGFVGGDIFGIPKDFRTCAQRVTVY